MGISKTERDLISLISNALFSAPIVDFVDNGWNTISKEAERQAVFPFLSTSELIPMEYRKALKKNASVLIANNMRVDYNHAELHELLTSNNLSYVVLKGCASASYYPEPTLRMMGDVDFLVSPNNVERAGEVLKLEGFSPWGVNHICHIVYTREDAHLEMHFEPAGVPEGKAGEIVRELLADVFEESRMTEVTGFEMCLPSHFHHGLILLLHTMHHLTSEGIGLRHLLDWAVFVNSFSDEEFREMFEEKLARSGLWRTAQLLTLVSMKYLGITPKPCAGKADDELLENIMSDILSGGNFGVKDKERGRAGMIISNRGKGGIGKKNYLFQFFDTLNHIIYTNWPITQKVKVLLPCGWLFWGIRYQLRVLTGKRKQLKLNRMVFDADQRGAIYKEFHLYEVEDEKGEKE